VTKTKTTAELYNTIPAALSEQYVRRLGYDPNMILCGSLTPDRIFFHVCLAAVQKHFFIDSLDEKHRSEVMWNIANRIYESQLNAFRSNSTQNENNFKQIISPEIIRFVEALDLSGKAEPFNKSLFITNWNVTDKYSSAWSRLAYNAYLALRINPQKGKQGDLGNVPLISSYVDLRYRHLMHWDEGEKLVNEYIAAHKTPIKNELKVRDMQEVDPLKRTVVSFLGGIGSGKSHMMRDWWENKRSQYPPDSFAVLDADFFKLALARRAENDKVLDKEDVNAVHAEASAIVTHISSLMAQEARNNRPSSNVLFASRGLKALREMNAFSGNTYGEFYFLSIDPHMAITAEGLRNTGTGRVVADKNEIIESCHSASQNLLSILERHIGSDAVVFIYERARASEAPYFIGAIDMKNGEVNIEKPTAMRRLLDRAKGNEIADRLRVIIEETPDAEAGEGPSSRIKSAKRQQK